MNDSVGKSKNQQECLVIECCRGRSCTYPRWVACTLVRSRSLGRRKALPLRRFAFSQQRNQLIALTWPSEEIEQLIEALSETQ